MVSRGKPKLLVVEDDGLIRLDLVDLLQEAGFDVIDAAHAEAALVLLETTSDVTALLTDIDMPGAINGIELARTVHQRWPDCRIVVISGRYHPAADVLPPATRFLIKPVSERRIEKVLKEMGVEPTG